MLWVHNDLEVAMPATITRATTAAELAAILLTYGDMPISAAVVDTCDGDEKAVVVADHSAVQLEIHTYGNGFRFLAVTGFREGC